MRYSIEPFARNIGTHATKVAKNVSNKTVKNLLIVLKNLQQMR